MRRPFEGLTWIYAALGLVALAALIFAGWGLTTLASNNAPPRQPAFTIEVIGHLWWWEIRYVDGNPSRVFTTANEIRIPVGKPVEVKLTTADVIHSFWVPTLGGKTDLIPGQTNVTWIEASRPGVFRGQCAEYCGQQHAHMAFLVVASSEEEFRAWREEQLKPAPPPQEDRVAAENAFVARCGICHNVRGTRAGGIIGPDLSHLMDRRTIAAGTLPNTVGNLAGWIADPQNVKPGNLMPRLELSGAELQQILSYLQTLQ